MKTKKRKPPIIILRLIRQPPLLLYKLGLGPLIGRIILLLTTTGRKSGLPRVTPLQYEEIDGNFYIGSARGQKADWFQNLVANPAVELEVKSSQFRGIAEPILDPGSIADFLEVRLQRRPRMVGAIMRSAGFPREPTRTDLEEYAARRAMVVIRPYVEGD